MNKKYLPHILIVMIVIAAGAATFVSSTYAAPASYTIAITASTTDGRTATLSGTAGANPYNGSLNAVHVGVQSWGDGSSTVPVADFVIVASSTSPKSFSATWSASHTYAAPGQYLVRVLSYHGEISDESEQFAEATTTVTIDPMIAASAGDGGTISPSGTVTVPYGTDRTFTFTADGGHTLNVLSVDGVPTTTADSYTFMDVVADHTIDAQFASGPQYTLTATTTGEGTGTITSDPVGIVCGSGGAACSANFPKNSTVTLTVSPDAPTSTFGGWGGDCAPAGTSTSCTITMGAAKSVSAAFDLRTYTLNVSAGGGAGDGVVSDASGTIYCDSTDASSTCSNIFTIGTPEVLYAAAGASSTFGIWNSGPCAGATSTSCSFTITAATTGSTIVAVFDLIPGSNESPVSVTIAGTGAGSVSSDPFGIDDCTAGTCIANFENGSTITLTATPSSTSIFAGWTGNVCDGSTSTVCSFIVATSTSVTATFDATTTLPSADISIAKTADVTSTAPGGTVNYHIVVTDLGPASSIGVVATDTLPSGLTFGNATASVGSYASSTGTWTIGTLMPNVTATLDIAASVDTGIESAAVTNIAAVTDDGLSTDPDLSNNSSSVLVSIISGEATSSADLSISKTVDNANPAPGATINYSIVVGNDGAAPATFVVANDAWPSGLTYVNATTSQGSMSLLGNGIDWNVGSLDPAATATMAVTMTVGAGTGGSTIANTATVSSTLGSFIDLTPADNSSTVAIIVSGGGGTPGGGSGDGGIGPVVAVGAGGPLAIGNRGLVLGASTGTPPVSEPPKPQGQVLGASTTCGYYLTNYIRPMSYRNANNDPADVIKLQMFLNKELDLNIPLTGYYGPMSEAAVRQFQLKYSTDILAPWVPHGLQSANAATGYVYKTTLRLINMLQCPSLGLEIPNLP